MCQFSSLSSVLSSILRSSWESSGIDFQDRIRSSWKNSPNIVDVFIFQFLRLSRYHWSLSSRKNSYRAFIVPNLCFSVRPMRILSSAASLTHVSFVMSCFPPLWVSMYSRIFLARRDIEKKWLHDSDLHRLFFWLELEPFPHDECVSKVGRPSSESRLLLFFWNHALFPIRTYSHALHRTQISIEQW